ncbi:MAG: TldD/PmbA family protein [Halanaerobium sp.]|nr:TldD/PmbA family protein [Halanaerobium sp.]
MLTRLKTAVANADCWTEIRYHKRLLTNVEVKNGIVSRAESKNLAGAGIRCLVDGSWGFVATSDVSKEGINKAIDEANKAARLGSSLKKEKIAGLAEGNQARGNFVYVEPGEEPSLEEKLELFLSAEEKIRSEEQMVIGIISYSKYDDQKIIINSDGAEAQITDNKQDIAVIAVAQGEDGQEMGVDSNGVTGTWDDLFAERPLDEMVNKTVNLARQKLAAGYAPGGQFTVILDPMLVGVLAHEAIGHTVESDFVLSGSIVKDKIGEQVASDLVTLVDDGNMDRTAGMTLVDDEGILSQRTLIIEDGILKDYLHNRESAYQMKAEPRGNARAYTYRDEPIVRMTNTFILPGDDDLEEMIKGIDDGFYLKGLGQGGQADANAEFMFGVLEAYRIKDGEVAEPVKGITISGQAFDVLKSVDAVGKNMKFALGRGFCGKGQPAKVDAGGPHLRCKVTIGGQQ